ncbi:hypothetical protein [Novosphingobium sp. BL-52-GroH]|uniref:hypothetical protein n=1 Tax=Novosphingobium sp. BL-52-GroH TaxID=3349877 RepID=UPI00384E8135
MTGSITINATIAGLVQITGLADLMFAARTAERTRNLQKTFVFGANMSTKSYTIRATGNEASISLPKNRFTRRKRQLL